ncbi:L-type lectin-domain containing receptor kinase VIII.2 [Rhynchospora pubera]|uniref:L-type lectin-domain containing receptor kinase VIII.2 n=1 Tax=Rhynchospora pubera TaxID=906938 RepID=A0AAV8FBS0_9POAL|nr:L-type lectin-domain containing receptor kinase VIII.2 [Rhynchospora pubera]
MKLKFVAMDLSYSFGFLFLFISLGRSLQIITEKPPPFAFSFDFSTENPKLHQIALLGASKHVNSSLHLPGPASSVLLKKPLSFSGKDPASGFTTHFSFSTIPENVMNFGELGFFLLPYKNGNEDSLIRSKDVLQLGLPPNTISVNLVSINKTENFIRINVGADLVAQSSGLSSPNLFGQLHCSINYNGISKRMEVRVSESKELKMMSALLSYPVDLISLLLKEKFFVGMRYSGRNLTQGINLISWSFTTDQGHIHSMHSEPLDPLSFVVTTHEDHLANHKRRGYPWGFLLVMVFAASCTVLLVWYTIASAWKSASSESGTYPIQAGYRKILMLEGESANGSLELEDFRVKL